MVNDGLISGTTRMENATGLPTAVRATGTREMSAGGSFEDIGLREANRAAPLQCRWCHKCDQKLAFLALA